MTGKNRYLHFEIPQDAFYLKQVISGKVPKEVEAITLELTQLFSRYKER